MVARVAGVVLLVPVCVLAVIGAAHTSADALIGWSLVGLGAGILVAVGAPRLRRGRQIGMHGPDLPLGVAAAATFVTVCLVIAGLLAAFGGGLTTAALLLFAVSGLWAGNHHRPRARATPVANPHDVLAAVTLPASSTLVADMGTEELCVAWRRSYYQLVLATDELGRAAWSCNGGRSSSTRSNAVTAAASAAGSTAAPAPHGDPGPYLTTRS